MLDEAASDLIMCIAYALGLDVAGHEQQVLILDHRRPARSARRSRAAPVERRELEEVTAAALAAARTRTTVAGSSTRRSRASMMSAARGAVKRPATSSKCTGGSRSAGSMPKRAA